MSRCSTFPHELASLNGPAGAEAIAMHEVRKRGGPGLLIKRRPDLGVDAMVSDLNQNYILTSHPLRLGWGNNGHFPLTSMWWANANNASSVKQRKETPGDILHGHH
jgi:hypothetical protein